MTEKRGAGVAGVDTRELEKDEIMKIPEYCVKEPEGDKESLMSFKFIVGMIRLKSWNNLSGYTR